MFNVGDILGAADVNEYLVNCRFAIKTSDTARPSNTTISDDPHLSVLMDANKTYQLEMFIQYHGLAGADMQWTFGAPTGAVLNGLSFGPDLAIAGATGPFKSVSYDGSIPITTTRTNGTRAVVTDDSLHVRGVVVNGSTSGNLTFRWAQNSSSATGTVVIGGSSMILRRVA